MIYEYPAIIKYEHKDSFYYVDFPDISGCFTDGLTLNEALENAGDALNTILSYYESKGYEIQQPRNINNIRLGIGEIVTIIRANTEFFIAV